MYKLSKQANQVIRKSDLASIPFAEGNSDYAEFLAWVAEGNTPDLFVASPEELAAEAQQTQDAADKVATKADAVVTYLVNHTPAEAEAYVLSHVTDLASAKAILGKMAMALSVVCKAELR